MKFILSALVAFQLLSQTSAIVFNDCDFEKDQETGPFGQPAFFEEVYDGTTIYGLKPKGDGPFPLVGYMHGDACGWEMYEKQLQHYASHGFIVVFPFIKSPKSDWQHWITDLTGEYLIKAVSWAVAANEQEDSPLYGQVDTANVVMSGHSMGAYCSILASHTLIEDPTIKLTLPLHPGGCAETQFAEVSEKHPVVMTMSSNDPLQKTDDKCFQNAMETASEEAVAAYIQFKTSECEDDGTFAGQSAYGHTWTDEGHYCELKYVNGGRPENPWAITALKLYAQQGGTLDSQCYNLLWGEGSESLKNSTWTDKIDLREGAPKQRSFDAEFLQ